MAREYISKIVLELQPRSHRCCRGLFGIRENKYFDEKLFDRNDFTQCFRKEFNQQVLFQGEHIECMNLIVAVKEIIKRRSANFSRNTRLEFRLRGVPFQNEENVSDDEEEEIKIYSPPINNPPIIIRNNASRCCSQCGKRLSNEEILIGTDSASRPAVCSSCYDSSFAEKCGRCWKPLTFDRNILRRDGSLICNYVSVNGSRWHVDCCKCAVCSQPLVGRDCYGNGYDDRLYCYDHG